MAFPLNALDSDYKFKFALIGGSGRSSLIDRFVKKKFNERFPSTIGFDLETKTITINGKTCKLEIWFSSSQYRFRPFQLEMLGGAHAVLIATDLTSPESSEQIQEWVNEAKTRASKNCIIVLVGTKSDLSDDRRISQEDIESICRTHNLPYFETSAKKNINITDVFRFAAADAKNKLDNR